MKKGSIQISSEKKQRLLRRIWQDNGRPYLKYFILSALILSASAGLDALAISMLKDVFDEGFIKNNLSALKSIAVLVFLLYTVKSLLAYIGGLIISKTSLNSVNNLRKRLIDHMLNLDMKFFDGANSSFFISRITGDCSSIVSVITSSVVTFFKQTVTVIAMVGLMFYYSWELSLVVFVFLPIGFLFIKYIMKRNKKLSTSLLQKNQNLLGRLTEFTQGMKIIKAYSLEKMQDNQVRLYLDELNHLAYKQAKVSSRSGPMMESLSGLVVASILIIGGYLISQGSMTAGEFVTFLVAWINAYKPLKQIANLSVSIQKGLVSADRVYQVLQKTPEIKDKPTARTFKGLKKEIVFKDINFSYDKNEKVFEKMSLTIPKGKTVALVGPSGGGKSTIVNLILRLYDVQGGKISFDGHNIKDFSQKSLRDNIAYVSQDILLFDSDIKENIACGKGENYGSIPDQDIYDVAKKAELESLLKKSKKGIYQSVGEAGKLLSGGQKQRVSIARAMIKDADIVLLDEATSALDVKTERQIQNALEKVSKGKTNIIVAHRLSTIKNADIIYAIGQGGVIEKGTHEELLKKGGFYASLYNSQFKK